MGMYRPPVLATLLAAALATGCGGRADQAAQTCFDAANAKVKGQTVDLSQKAMAAAAKPQGEDTIQIQVPIVFDAGLSSESKQTLDCRVRFTANGPEILSLTFVF